MLATQSSGGGAPIGDASTANPDELTDEPFTETPAFYAIVAVAAVLVCCLLVLCIVCVVRRRGDDDSETYAGTTSMKAMEQGGGAEEEPQRLEVEWIQDASSDKSTESSSF